MVTPVIEDTKIILNSTLTEIEKHKKKSLSKHRRIKTLFCYVCLVVLAFLLASPWAYSSEHMVSFITDATEVFTRAWTDRNPVMLRLSGFSGLPFG